MDAFFKGMQVISEAIEGLSDEERVVSSTSDSWLEAYDSTKVLASALALLMENLVSAATFLEIMMLSLKLVYALGYRHGKAVKELNDLWK